MQRKKSKSMVDPKIVKKIKRIHKSDLAVFNNEKKEIAKRLSCLQSTVPILVNQLKQYKDSFDSYRKFNKGIINNGDILNFLYKYKIPFEYHDEVRNLISKNLYRKINQKDLVTAIYERFKKITLKCYLDEQRGNLFPEFIYDFLPANSSVSLKNGKFDSIIQHYNDIENSINVKMFVSASLEPVFKSIYDKIYKDFSESDDEKIKIYSCLILITMLTGIRPGTKIGTVVKHDGDEKIECSTYGLTTLTKDHISFDDGKCYFNFIGKKGTDNKFTIEEPSIVEYLFELYNEDKIFKYGDEQVDYNDFFKYFINTTGFTPSDFRKRIANITLHKCLSKYNGESICDFLNQVYSDVAVALNHKTSDGSVAIESYCNPKILVRWLSGVHSKSFSKSVSNDSFEVKYVF